MARTPRRPNLSTTGTALLAAAVLAQSAVAGAATAAPARPRAQVDGLTFSTYLGDHDPDQVRDLDVDAGGNVYLLSVTGSKNFPVTRGAFDRSFNGGTDLAVSKLDPTGSDLIWSTFLGGSGFECSPQCGMTVDAAGAVYVVGSADAADFPTTDGAFDTTPAGRDGFVAKLLPDGSGLAYSTRLGGSESEIASEVDVDATGAAYVTGGTDSADFPTTPGAFDPIATGASDAFVTKVSPDGAALGYSTRLGGSEPGAGGETGFAVEVDDAGAAYVVGLTPSPDFPVSAGAFDETANGAEDAFVSKLDPLGSSLAYSTYLGGADLDHALHLDVDGQGSATVVGRTRSADFPTAGAGDTTLGSPGLFDGFAVRLDAGGTALHYGTFLGGAEADTADGVVVDDQGDATVVGGTSSADFPLTDDALDAAMSRSEAFVTRVGASDGGVDFSTFLGGSEADSAEAVTLGPDAAVRVGGATTSPDLPTTPGAYDTRFSSKAGADGWVAAMSP